MGLFYVESWRNDWAFKPPFPLNYSRHYSAEFCPHYGFAAGPTGRPAPRKYRAQVAVGLVTLLAHGAARVDGRVGCRPGRQAAPGPVLSPAARPNGCSAMRLRPEQLVFFDSCPIPHVPFAATSSALAALERAFGGSYVGSTRLRPLESIWVF